MSSRAERLNDIRARVEAIPRGPLPTLAEQIEENQFRAMVALGVISASVTFEEG